MTPTQITLNKLRPIPLGAFAYLRVRLVDRGNGLDEAHGVAVQVVDKLGRAEDGVVHYVTEASLLKPEELKR